MNNGDMDKRSAAQDAVIRVSEEDTEAASLKHRDKSGRGTQSANTGSAHSEDYRSLLLLDELSKNDEITQRALSSNLGVALGLVNSYIKNLASKGYITISSIPRNRYKYFITPKGIREKTRLTYEHLKNYTNLFKVARKDFQGLFIDIEGRGLKRIAFSGVDEITEIAFLSLKESELELVGVFDDKEAGKRFFGLEILPLSKVSEVRVELWIITSFKRGDDIKDILLRSGVSEDMILDVSEGGWMNRIARKEG
jgi:DNA-binding MarR family transcriptional regulator